MNVNFFSDISRSKMIILTENLKNLKTKKPISIFNYQKSCYEIYLT